MDFEQWFLSFMKTVKGDDAEDIAALLIIHDFMSADDLLDAPIRWLEKHCTVVAESEGIFQIYKHKKDGRYFINDEEDPSGVLTQLELIATEEVELDNYDFDEIDLDKYDDAVYCGELINSTHCNKAGKAVVNVGWFKIKIN